MFRLVLICPVSQSATSCAQLATTNPYMSELTERHSMAYDEEHIKGLYGRWQMRSMTTTKAMTMAQSAPGTTVRLNTSSPSVTGAGAAPAAFFLLILATSSPSPSPRRRILQLLLQKLPCTVKLGTCCWAADVPDDAAMCTSTSSVPLTSEHCLMEKKSCCCRLRRRKLWSLSPLGSSDVAL